MTQDKKAGEKPTEGQGTVEEEVTDETFVDTWIRRSRNNCDLDDDILALIDEYRDGMSLDEDSLYNALLNHAKEKLKNDG